MIADNHEVGDQLDHVAFLSFEHLYINCSS